MIRSFLCKETERIFNGYVSKKFPGDIQERALRKLRMLHAALNLQDLKNPPSNHLEKLKGDLVEYMSIRINNQWRICFIWKNLEVCDVFICDYH